MQDVTRIKDWTAKRAGGRITITGRDADDGEPLKIVGVDTIASREPGKPPIATDRNGETYQLI